MTANPTLRCWRAPLLAATLFGALTGCGGGMLTGPLAPSALRTHDEKWEVAFAAARPSPEASRALANVPPGAELVVVLGTWCGDSRREVSRFVKALDLAGPVPFAVRWIGVDRDKRADGFDAAKLGVRYVPTFIVSRDGKELGRVVETAPNGIERDVGALLRGEKTGVLSVK